MCKKLVFLLTTLLMLCPVKNATADLEAYYKFDEGSGTMALDSSGNNHHGTLNGGASWAGEGSPVGGDAVSFDGFSDGVHHSTDPGTINWVSVDPFDVVGPGITLAAWIRPDGFDITDARVVTKQKTWSSSEIWWMLSTFTDGTAIRMRLKTDDGGADAGTTTMISGAGHLQTGVWSHVAATYDGSKMRLHHNGVEIMSGDKTGTIQTDPSAAVAIGNGPLGSPGGLRATFNGLIDEVLIYTQALTPEEIQEAMKGLAAALASGPSPTDGETDVPRDAVLSWTPGEFAPPANGHAVYIGDNFDDVNDATGGATQDAASYDPGRLSFETTYYWRVDEVNGAPDFTVYGGEIWSFTAEPIAYPIPTITATASGSFGASGAENTINGSGLAGDLHGTSAADMWISAGIPATIEYDFDRAYKLHELWIWNSNQLIEAFVGFGAKDVVIEHSLDGENWTVLEGVGPLAQATGAGGYSHNNTIDFGGVTARHVRVTINSVQGIAPQASLSEVRFLAIPTLATRPSPASGASDVSPHVPLAWGRDGREAGSHDVYLGTDPDNLSLAGSVSASSLDTLAVDLQLSQTYYWRVDEVNNAMEPSVWTGDVWSFSTVDAIVIDDMESYRDEEFFEIWATWIDGFNDPANGALVGANPGIGDFSPESTIVNAGDKSLPIHYNNSAAAQSEATRAFAVSQDWTGAGVTQLVVWFHGTAGNTGLMYLKLNGTKILYEGPAADIALAAWQAWNIDLASLGMDLQSVRSLAVGIEGNGATGTLYVDDISLE